MSGRRKTYFVKLTEAETVKLEQLVAARKSPQSLAKRAKVTLCCAAHPDWSDAQVASSVGGSVAWVRKWRKQGGKAALSKKPPGVVARESFCERMRAGVTAIACTLSE
jgi:hypothetical protein